MVYKVLLENGNTDWVDADSSAQAIEEMFEFTGQGVKDIISEEALEDKFYEDLLENPFEEQVSESDFRAYNPTEKQLNEARKEFFDKYFVTP